MKFGKINIRGIGAVLAVLAVVAGLSVCVPPQVRADGEGPGLRITWNAPKDVPADQVKGYNVYRADSPKGPYDKLNGAPLEGLLFDDAGLVSGKEYYYRVTTVFEDGTESKPTDPSGLTAGAAAGDEYRLPKAEFFTSNALGRVLYEGSEAIFVLKSSPGLSVTLSVAGAIDGQVMYEVQPGTYKCVHTVQAGLSFRGRYAEAIMTDDRGGTSSARTPSTISFLGLPGPSLAGLYVGTLESGRVGLNWPEYPGIEGTFSIYRDTAPLLDLGDEYPLAEGLPMGANAYMDVAVNPDTTYYYVLAVVDGDGWITEYTDNLEVTVPHPGRVSGIEYVREDSGGRTLRPGDTLTVTMKTSPGGKASFTLAEAARGVPMAGEGDGVYTGLYTVREGDGVFRSRVSASFRDSEGATHFLNSATYVTVDAPADIPVTAGGVAPVIEEVTDDTLFVAGSSGRLAAGKTFTVTAHGDSGCTCFFNVGDGIWKVPMAESGSEPGLYAGSYTVRPGDNAGTSEDPEREAFVTVYLVSPDGAVSEPAAGNDPVIIDTSVNIQVDAEADYLPADGRSRTGISVVVTDVDGEPVEDRRLTFLVEPPEKYTGIVGGGGFGFDAPTSEAGDSDIGRVEPDFDDMTDFSGEMSATYTTGYAAKTAMIVVRDYLTGSVGMDYVRTGISSTVSVTLEDQYASDATDAEPPVYDLVIEFVPEEPLPEEVSLPWFMVDAFPDTLTADGRSRASIFATLTKDGMPVEGMEILFSVMGAGGTFTSYSDRTDVSGLAQTFFIAGTRAGRALITATEAGTGVTVTKSVTLLADAPVKIYARAYPDTLPADGMSSAELVVEMADANGNPTPDVEVGFELAGLNGTLSDGTAVTDERGFCSVDYTAGENRGVAVVSISAVSPEPGPEYLEEAMNRVVAPTVYDNNPFTELRVVRWFRQQGEYVGAGESLALVDTPLGSITVRSPATGMLDEIVIGNGIIVMEGKEIGIISK